MGSCRTGLPLRLSLCAAKGCFPMPAAIRRALPDHPGIYRMRSLGGDLLYIGKSFQP